MKLSVVALVVAILFIFDTTYFPGHSKMDKEVGLECSCGGWLMLRQTAANGTFNCCLHPVTTINSFIALNGQNEKFSLGNKKKETSLIFYIGVLVSSLKKVWAKLYNTLTDRFDLGFCSKPKAFACLPAYAPLRLNPNSTQRNEHRCDKSILLYLCLCQNAARGMRSLFVLSLNHVG